MNDFEVRRVDSANSNPEHHTLTTVIYALQGAGYFFAITILIAIMINYVKRAEVKGSLYESHFRWQIRTFWFSILWLVIGIVTTPFLIGYLILFANWVWGIYRIVKGWLYLNDRKEI